MKKPTLIPEWRTAWKFWSVQAMAALAGLPLAYMALPADWQAAIPDSWKAGAVGVVLLAGIVGRVIDQKPKAP
jgi:hypothetical protein